MRNLLILVWIYFPGDLKRMGLALNLISLSLCRHSMLGLSLRYEQKGVEEAWEIVRWPFLFQNHDNKLTFCVKNKNDREERHTRATSGSVALQQLGSVADGCGPY